MNDVAFHFVFGRKERQYNLINLLNAVLSKPQSSQITDLILEETQFEPEIIGLKSCRLDLRAQTNQGEQIAVEVQIHNEGNILKRSLFYWSKLYSSQLKAGEDYRELNKAIAINILDFSFLEGSKVHTVSGLMDLDTQVLITQLLEVHFLEIPKLKLTKPDLNCALTRWLVFLSGTMRAEQKEEILMRDEDIRIASEDLARLKLDPNARRMYELREKALMDWRNAEAYIRETSGEEGRKAGFKVGFAEGRKEGRQEGRQEGELAAKRKIATELVALGMSVEEICRITGLSRSELEEL